MESLTSRKSGKLLWVFVCVSVPVSVGGGGGGETCQAVCVPDPCSVVAARPYTFKPSNPNEEADSSPRPGLEVPAVSELKDGAARERN